MSVESKLTELEKRLDEKLEKHSVAWLMTENAKRWFTVAMTILFLWFATIGVFVWYLNQYDFISQDGSGYNNVVTGESGDINNGAVSPSEEKK